MVARTSQPDSEAQAGASALTGKGKGKAQDTIAKRANRWIVGEDTGLSSEAIWAHMMDVERKAAWAPADPSDLGRCLRLLRLIPEWKARIGEMARYGAEWAALVPAWDELESLMAAEVGIDWSKGRSAPRTYARMQEIRQAIHG